MVLINPPSSLTMDRRDCQTFTYFFSVGDWSWNLIFSTSKGAVRSLATAPAKAPASTSCLTLVAATGEEEEDERESNKPIVSLHRDAKEIEDFFHLYRLAFLLS